MTERAPIAGRGTKKDEGNKQKGNRIMWQFETTGKGTGETICFGNLNWLVIDETTDGKARLLLCEQSLYMPWVPDELIEDLMMGRTSITWERSETRRALNSEFLSEHFDDDEQERIMAVSLANEGNPFGKGHDEADSRTTVDKVFMLSLDEVVRYLSNDPEAEEMALIQGEILYTRTPLDAGCPIRFHIEDLWGEWAEDADYDRLSGQRLPAIRERFPEIDGVLEHTMNAWVGVDEDEISVRPAMWVKTGD